MKTNEIIDQLTQLHQLDVDSVEALEEAIITLDNEKLRKRIEIFRSEHLMNIQSLEELILDLGGQRPTHGQDIKGFLIEGVTKLRSALGEKQALKAIKQNEEISTKKYEAALLSLQQLHASRGIIETVKGLLHREYGHYQEVQKLIDYPELIESKRSA